MFEEDKLPESDIDNAYDDIDDIGNIEEVEPTTNEDEVVEASPDKKKKHKKEKKVKKPKKSKKDASQDGDVVEVSDDDTSASTKPAKSDKTKKRNKIIAIVVASILAVAILVIAITVPIAIANKDKIFVSSAEDFANTDGKYFVLKDNITIDSLTLGAITNIDFNGKTLTVKNFKIDNKNNDKIVLGNVLDGGLSQGALNATNIDITTSGDIVIGASIDSSDIKIVANNITLLNGVNTLKSALLKANKIDINKNFTFASSKEDTTLKILDASTVNILGKVSGSLSFDYTKENTEDKLMTTATINGDVSQDILADKDVELVINSKVGGKIDSNDKTIDEENNVTVNSKVGKVKLLENSFVKYIYNTRIIYRHVDAVKPITDGSYEAYEFIKALPQVGYITINDDTDKIILNFAKVEGADTYNVVIDDKINKEITETNLDITEYVSDVKKHRISVQAVSKAKSELLLPSRVLVYEYMTYTTLAKASNIKITPDAEGKLTLTFDKVNFADEYAISINGNEFITSKLSNDVTPFIKDGGTYIIKIIARSKNENIKDSKPSLAQYDYKKALDEVKLTITNDKENIIFSWNEVKNADHYEVILVDSDREKVIYNTPNNEFKSTVGKNNEFAIKSGQKFKIRAISANTYLTTSESEVVVYEYQVV